MKLSVIAVPFDSGVANARMGRGPEALLRRGLVEKLRALGAEVELHKIVLPIGIHPAEIRVAFELQRLIAERVASACRAGAMPVVLAGNCNSASGVTAGLRAVFGRPPVVCWFDAHGDFNTPESTVGGFLDGMAVAMLTGRCWGALSATVPGFEPIAERDVVMVGVRDVDPLEGELLATSEVQRLDLAGALEAVPRALHEDQAATRPLCLHVDLDVLDPSEGRANSYAALGGLTGAELIAGVGELASGAGPLALSVTAYDPEADERGTIGEIAVDLLVRAATARNPLFPVVSRPI